MTDININQVIDVYDDALSKIFAHVEYVENWRVFPIDDQRSVYWAVDNDENTWVRFSPSREALKYWLVEHDDEYGPYGNVLYQNVIYTQRHLPKWVYRGPQLVLIVVDTQTDGNKFLQLFDPTKEIKT